MTADPRAACLDDAALDACAHAAPDDPAQRAAHLHLAQCAACRQRYTERRDELAFLERIRSATPAAAGHGSALPLPYVAGYDVIETISAGAQGIIYRAQQQSTHRSVAIKMVAAGLRADERQQWRLAREAEIVAQLRHPGVVTVYETVTLPDGRLAIVMEYIDGVPLDAWRPDTGSAVTDRRQWCDLLAHVADAVHHAHLNGVIHRDLKPANILVDRGGQPHVLDFGLARRGRSGGTRLGEFAGTPAYASPEQAAGDPQRVDALTDVYALGVLLYRVLCDAFPYDLDGSIMQMAQTIRTAPPTPPREHVPALTGDLDAILLRALEKRPEARYASAAAFAADVRRALQGLPVEARTASGWYVLRKAIQMNRRRIVAALVAVVVLATTFAVVQTSLQATERARRREAAQRAEAHREHVRQRAVTELLRTVLPAADPAHPDVTDAVNRGLKRLYLQLDGGGYAADPELDREMRRLWGSLYAGVARGKGTQLAEYAEVALRHGIIRLRAAPGAVDDDALAALTHELASLLMFRNRLDEAATCIAETAARLEARPDVEPSRRAATALLAAQIDTARGRIDDARRALDRADERLAHADDPDLVVTRGAIDLLRVTHALAQRESPDGADIAPALDRAVRAALAHGPVDAPAIQDALALLATVVECDLESADRSDVLRAARMLWPGSPAHAAAAIRHDVDRLALARASGHADAIERVIALQAALLGPDHPVLIASRLDELHALEQSTELLRRCTVAERAAEQIAEHFGPNDLAVLMCLEQAATDAIFAGAPDRAVALEARALAIWDALGPAAVDPLYAANTRRRLAWALDLARRHDEAERAYRVVLDELRAVLGPDHYLLAITECGLALSMLDQGKADAATAIAQPAFRRAARTTEGSADQRAHVAFAEGRLALAHDDPNAALAHFDRAWTLFYRDLTALDFPWSRTLIDHARDAARRAGDEDSAAVWDRRAASRSAGT